MRLLALAAATTLLAAAAPAQPARLAPALAGLSFLVGTWAGDDGQVADTGQISKGSSTIEAEAGGAVLLRRDHVSLFDRAGHAAGGFDLIMTVYADAGTIRADYVDGSHVIHYIASALQPGRLVMFESAPAAGVPTFHLSYRAVGPGTLALSFSMTPPGARTPRPIAVGRLRAVR